MQLFLVPTFTPLKELENSNFKYLQLGVFDDIYCMRQKDIGVSF